MVYCIAMGCHNSKKTTAITLQATYCSADRHEIKRKNLQRTRTALCVPLTSLPIAMSESFRYVFTLFYQLIARKLAVIRKTQFAAVIISLKF